MDIDHLLKKFHVITVISNPVRYRSRAELYKNFKKHVQCAHKNLWTVEIAFGDRPYQVTDPLDPRSIQFRSFHEIWHKENMINLALARLPQDWEYVAWVDADLMFQNPNWVTETVQQLQHYMIVQMFGTAIDLGPQGEPLQIHRGFVKGYFDSGFTCPNNKRDGYYGGPSGSFAHPGYAWAARREAIEALGGLIDWAILGSADHHMAMALIGQVEKTFPNQINSRYIKKILLWQERALKHLHKDIGYVPGTVSHYWHGKKKDRKYQDRWSILLNNNFDPDKDIMKDWQGLWEVTNNNPRFRDQVRAYFRARNEDSIDL